MTHDVHSFMSILRKKRNEKKMIKDTKKKKGIKFDVFVVVGNESSA